MSNQQIISRPGRKSRAAALWLIVIGCVLALAVNDDSFARGGGGGRGGGAGGAARGGGGGRMAQNSVSGANRSMGGGAGNRPNAGNMANSGNRANAGNKVGSGNNRGNRVNAGNNNKINNGRINNGNVNVGNNVNVNIDGGYNNRWGQGGYHGGGYHPIAAGVVIGAMAITTAAVVGSYYRTLPVGCTTVIRNGATYSYCGSVYYQQTWSGNDVVYVVASP